MNVQVADVYDLIESAEDIGVKLETILIPGLSFAAFKRELERWQVDHPVEMKKFVGLRMVPHYPTVSKYNSLADKIDAVIQFYAQVADDGVDVERAVYNHFGIDRAELAMEQQILAANMGKADAINN
ncbi:MAG: hypothetical protein IJA20_02730 [Methanocorpusculum sp.]|nr:hypothetical protein [Methanocorpusculum sp.]